MSIKILLGDEQFPIRPDDIDINMDFTKIFDTPETGVAAKTILSLCQSNKGWKPFYLSDANKVHKEVFGRIHDFSLYRLSDGWIIKMDSVYYVTVDFIMQIFRAQLLQCK